MADTKKPRDKDLGERDRDRDRDRDRQTDRQTDRYRSYGIAPVPEWN